MSVDRLCRKFERIIEDHDNYRPDCNYICNEEQRPCYDKQPYHYKNYSHGNCNNNQCSWATPVLIAILVAVIIAIILLFISRSAAINAD